MAKVITTELQHSGASSANITLDSSKNVTAENNLTVDGNLAVTGTTTLTGAVELPDDTVDIADLSATGTASSSTFLRGDNSWAEAGGGSRTLISTTTLSGTNTSLTSLDFSDYLYLEATVYGATIGSGNIGDYFIRFNNDTGNNYSWLASRMDNNGSKSHGGSQSGAAFYINMTGVAGWTSGTNYAHFELRNINLSGSKKLFRMNAGGELGGGEIVLNTNGWWDNSNAITRIDIGCDNSLTGGTIKLYGVK